MLRMKLERGERPGRREIRIADQEAAFRFAAAQAGV
jgi:hypothetical protein